MVSNGKHIRLPSFLSRLPFSGNANSSPIFYLLTYQFRFFFLFFFFDTARPNPYPYAIIINFIANLVGVFDKNDNHLWSDRLTTFADAPFSLLNMRWILMCVCVCICVMIVLLCFLFLFQFLDLMWFFFPSVYAIQ